MLALVGWQGTCKQLVRSLETHLYICVYMQRTLQRHVDLHAHDTFHTSTRKHDHKHASEFLTTALRITNCLKRRRGLTKTYTAPQNGVHATPSPNRHTPCGSPLFRMTGVLNRCRILETHFELRSVTISYDQLGFGPNI